MKRDWDNFFKAEDFQFEDTNSPTDRFAECLANNANKLLREALKEAPVVYGCKGSDGKYYMDEREDRKEMPAYTHSAKLIDVKEIK